MDNQGSQNSSAGPGGVVPGPTYDPFKFRILKAMLRLLVAAYGVTCIIYMAVYFVAYESNVYMDTHVIMAACFLAFCFSCATNLFEPISLLWRRGPRSWSMIFDLTSIWTSAAACIYITVMKATYFQDPLAIHDNSNKHLLDTLHIVSMLTVILAVFHVLILALTLISYYLNRRVHGSPNDHIPGQRGGDLPLVDLPQHGRSGSHPGREGTVTLERPIVFPDDSLVAGPSRPGRVVLPPLYNEPPLVVSRSS